MLRLGSGISYGSPPIAFDSTRKVREGLACVSHAHSDHARSHEVRTLMTEETSKITGIDSEPIRYGMRVPYGEYEIEAFPAGHMAGSVQFKVSDGQEMVYTGDFKLEDDLLFKGAEPIACDELVIESTFGRPEYCFPDREEVYSDISSWVTRNLTKDRIVLLGGYAVGKGQELTKLINEYCGVTPLVHPKVKKVNDACEHLGLELGESIVFDSEEGEEMSRGAFICIIPPSLMSFSALNAISIQYKRKVVSSVATGWAGIFRRDAFPLSDHADFTQLVEYVERANPKRVYTVHGHKKELARYLRRKGFNAAPLEKKGQSSLISF